MSTTVTWASETGSRPPLDTVRPARETPFERSSSTRVTGSPEARMNSLRAGAKPSARAATRYAPGRAGIRTRPSRPVLATPATRQGCSPTPGVTRSPISTTAIAIAGIAFLMPDPPLSVSLYPGDVAPTFRGGFDEAVVRLRRIEQGVEGGLRRCRPGPRSERGKARRGDRLRRRRP